MSNPFLAQMRAEVDAKVEKARALLQGKLSHFISRSQRIALRDVLSGEEREAFVDMITALSERIDTMPGPYGQDGKGDDAVVYLHYFRGSVDAWITERDSTDEQLQAFGRIDLGYGPELGYISIRELTDNGVELDLHWTPKPLRECKR